MTRSPDQEDSMEDTTVVMTDDDMRDYAMNHSMVASEAAWDAWLAEHDARVRAELPGRRAIRNAVADVLLYVGQYSVPASTRTMLLAMGEGSLEEKLTNAVTSLHPGA